MTANARTDGGGSMNTLHLTQGEDGTLGARVELAAGGVAMLRGPASESRWFFRMLVYEASTDLHPCKPAAPHEQLPTCTACGCITSAASEGKDCPERGAAGCHVEAG